MQSWKRQGNLNVAEEHDRETWIRMHEGLAEEFPVEVYLGKKTDLLKLKKSIVTDLKNQLRYYRESREKLYANPDKESVDACPVCGSSAEAAESKVIIYGAEYVQCQGCSHVYVRYRPSKRAIHDFYLNDITYAATYTDKKSAESRLQAIAVPWVEWMLEVYKRQYGRTPRSILDVGSGAGHFVEACRRKGIVADGIELSKSSRDFAREIWGFELDGRDFTEVASDYAGYEVVTFWGLLEHTPHPGAILRAAHEVFVNSGSAMVIAKVPRWDSLSSAVQRLNTSTIIRHLDPMGHIMAFTDASIAELYYKCGFKPVAAWYYGMDIYETLMQIGHMSGNYTHLTNTGALQVELQQFVDNIRFSDGITLVGVQNN